MSRRTVLAKIRPCLRPQLDDARLGYAENTAVTVSRAVRENRVCLQTPRTHDLSTSISLDDPRDVYRVPCGQNKQTEWRAKNTQKEPLSGITFESIQSRLMCGRNYPTHTQELDKVDAFRLQRTLINLSTPFNFLEQVSNQCRAKLKLADGDYIKDATFLANSTAIARRIVRALKEAARLQCIPVLGNATATYITKSSSAKPYCRNTLKFLESCLSFAALEHPFLWLEQPPKGKFCAICII